MQWPHGTSTCSVIGMQTSVDWECYIVSRARAPEREALAAMATYEESILAANSNGRKFLYHSKGLDAGSLLVK